jgi:uncharacterized protein (DUF4213/DUF364 family)
MEGDDMSILDRLLDACVATDGPVADVRIGVHWTSVVVERRGTGSLPADEGAGTAHQLSAGLAATLTPEGWEHGRPWVREASRLKERTAAELAGLLRSESPTERSVGLAALNALHQVPPDGLNEGNADEILFRLGQGKRVAVIGHFPFVDRLREIAGACWVLELHPGPLDRPAEEAPELLPEADVVAITGMTLLNGTFESLVSLPKPDAFVMLLGPSTPLTPLFFDYGIDAVSGTVVMDIQAVLQAVSQGASFRQIPGKRLLTIFNPESIERWRDPSITST